MAVERLNDDVVIPASFPLHKAIAQALTLLSGLQCKPMARIFLPGKNLSQAAEKAATLLGTDIQIHAVPQKDVPPSYDAVAELLIFSPTSNRYFHFSPRGDEGTTINIFRVDSLGKWLSAIAGPVELRERLDSAMESVESACDACGLTGPYHHFLCREVPQS